MMIKRKSNAWRFLSLGALTAASGAATLFSFKAMSPAETIPFVDAMAAPPPVGDEWPTLSIIVPARNEERNLPRLLPTLLAQRYPSYEVIVVDDQSDDATPRILASWAEKEGRLEVVQGEELPRSEGWLGKPFAMHQGARKASGEWLLFTDADTTHDPLSASSSIAYALSHDVDLLTIGPRAELITPSERLLMPVAFEGIYALYPPNKVNDPRSKVAIANGQYMLIRRDVYNDVGGIARVKDKIAEDLEFGKAVKSDGHRLYMADGRHLMSVRMYTSFAEVWEGWSKNVVLSFRENPATGLLSVFGLFSIAFMPYLMLRWCVLAWRDALKSRKPADRAAAAWVTALTIWGVGMPFYYRRRTDQALGLPLGWTFTQPLGALVFALIMLNSLRRLLTGRGVTWKGRTYAGKPGVSGS